MQSQQLYTPTTASVPSGLASDENWVNWLLFNGADKRPIAPYATGHFYPAAWKSDRDSTQTDYETAVKFAELSLGQAAVRYGGFPDEADRKVPGVGYVIPDADDVDPAESVTLIDLDDVRDPDTGALHPTAIKLIDKADSFAQVSTSGTGVHILVRGSLPDGVGSIESHLEATDAFPNAEIEVYDNDRFIAFTGDQIQDTPCEVRKRQDILDSLADEFVTVTDEKPTVATHDAALSEEEISSIDSTDNIRDIFDAIRHITIDDIRLKSEVTEERSDGSLSLDPAWARSNSGTRLAYQDGAWIYRKGMVGLDAVQVVALEERIIRDVDEYPDGDDFWDTIEALRRRGADIPEYDPGRMAIDKAALLPKVTGPEEGSGPSLDEIHQRVENTIADSMDREEDALIDAIMGSGKTFSSFKAAKETGTKMAYFAPRTDLYNQARQYALEAGFSEDEIFVCPSVQRSCPTFNGEHGSGWEQRVKGQYRAGVRARKIHKVNEDIPCHSEDDENHTCPYVEKWQDYDEDQHKVVIGHYTHAHLPIVTSGRTVVFDESTGSAFTERLEGSQLITAVNTFLEEHNIPADDFHDLLQAREDRSRKERIIGWFSPVEDRLEADEDRAADLFDEGYHALAPLAVYAIVDADPIAEGSSFEKTFLPGYGHQALFFTTDDQYGNYYVEIRDSPNLEYVRNVIALDGTPLVDESKNDPHRPREWISHLQTPLEHKRVLSNDERAEYLEHTLGHTYVQTTDAIKPYSSGKYANAVEDRAVLAAVTEVYGDGDPPVVFTPKKVLDGDSDGTPGYSDLGWEEDGIVDTFDYPGNIRGTDRYGSERLAVQLGSTHHGDHELARRAAWLGHTIDPEGRGADRSYGNPVADKILEQMREAQTLQNILRVGRDGGGATVVLHTSAFPDWLPVHGFGSVEPWSDGRRDVIAAWKDIWRQTSSGVETETVINHPEVSVSERQVRRVLRDFADEYGLLYQDDHPDDGRKVVWKDDGLADIELVADEEFDLPDFEAAVPEDIEDGGETIDIGRIDVYTRNVAIFPKAIAQHRTLGDRLEQHYAPDGESGASAPPG